MIISRSPLRISLGGHKKIYPHILKKEVPMVIYDFLNNCLYNDNKTIQKGIFVIITYLIIKN